MGDDMSTQDILLSTGAVVRCRPVPPYMMLDMYDTLPLPPVYPKVTLKSPAGDEKAPALPETEEYVEYRRKQRAWEIERGRHTRDFSLDVGIVAWKLSEDEEFQSEPPEDWTEDPAAARWGLKSRSTRLAYITQALLATDPDATLVERVINELASLTEKEITAAGVPFGSSEKIDQSSLLEATKAE